MTCSCNKGVSINFELGEGKPLKFKATGPTSDDFVISTATYEIKHYDDVIEQGEMLINGHEISMFWIAAERGKFDLYINFTVADSQRIKHFLINVD